MTGRLPPSKRRVKDLERELSVAMVELTTAAGLLERAGLPDTAKVMLQAVEQHKRLYDQQSGASRPTPKKDELIKRLHFIAAGFDGAGRQLTEGQIGLREEVEKNAETIREAVMVLQWQG